MRPQDVEMIERLKTLNIIPHDRDNILYKYASIEDAIKILEGGTLLYQTPNNFNDPFEMHLGLLDYRQAAIDSFWNRASQKYTQAQIDLLRQKTTDDDWVRLTEDVLVGNRSNTGVLCLSKTNVSTLMWSHYSKKHTGVCIGFRIADGFPNTGTVAFEVNYASSVNPRTFTVTNGLEDLITFTYWICTKSHIWSYEQEIRVISMTAHGLLPFNKYQLCELYFGVGTTQEDINTITNIIQRMGYRLYCIGKMFIDKKSFDLKPTYFPPYIINFPTKLPKRN